LELAKVNSDFFWKKNIERQKEETLFELIEENNISPNKPKVYKNPIKSATENNLILRDIKNGSIELREEIKNK
jgi:uncharacterized protein involved in tolerance to divalent cations